MGDVCQLPHKPLKTQNSQLLYDEHDQDCVTKPTTMPLKYKI